MNEQKLLSAIDSASATSYSSEDSGNLSDIRARSIDDYLGEPYGDEVEGQSQVVSRDVYDTVEWILPAMCRIFTGGDSVCAFDPIGPQDEDQAKQESEYINHVILDKNDWFNVFYEWCKDGLLTKNAYIMAYWDNSVEIEQDEYTGLTDNQLTMLLNDGWELKAHSAKPDEDAMQQYMAMAQMAQQQGMPFDQQPPQLHDVEVIRKQPKNKICIKVLPPERVKVGEDTPNYSLKDCNYFEYWEYLTVSQLRALGLDVDDSESDAISPTESQEDAARDQYGEEQDQSVSTDPSMRKLKTRMIWIRCDANEDGIAEMIYCIRIGSKIKYSKEYSRICVSSMVPIPMPHRHVGLSIRDAVTDIQRIKTVIWRQTLNNLYLANNGRYGVSDKVNLDDMLTSRPGGVVRVNGIPQQEIFPFTHPFIGTQALGVMEYADQLKDSRTGVNKVSAGLDPKAIDANVGTVSQLTSAASQRLELIARIIANGVKELFQIVHELTLKHDHKKSVVKLSGNWVEVDPTQWKKRQDLRITVGVNAGNKEVLLQQLMMIGQQQEKGLQIGIATPEKIYNTALEFTKAAGFPNGDRFWQKPNPNPPPPQDPNAGILAVEKYKADKKADTDLKTNAADNFTKKQIALFNMTGDQQALAAEFQHDKEMAAIQHHSDMAKSRQDHAESMDKARHDERVGVSKDLRAHISQTVAREHGANLDRLSNG